MKNGHAEGAHDDVLWTAFQYVACELTDAAALQFEERLEADESAREAVAEAVAIYEAVRLAESLPIAACATGPSGNIVPAAVHASAWRHVATWVAIVAAACVLVAVGIGSRPGAPERGTPEIAQRETLTPATVAKSTASKAKADSQSELAALWIENQADDESFYAEMFRNSQSLEPFVFDEAESLSLFPSADEPTAPDWLIAALTESESVKN